jgi:hypothetical protein
MKKFVINISYSWGDEEEPIKMNVADKWMAFRHMCNLAVKELSIECDEHPEYAEYTTMKVFENKIIIHYGHDNEECYYELEEI